MGTDIPITWVENLRDFSLWADGPNRVGFCRPDLTDGAAQWERADDGAVTDLTYVCPCGCKEWRQIPVGASHWAWDGNETSPTLTPSILHMKNRDGDCGWHGYLTAGVWETC